MGHISRICTAIEFTLLHPFISNLKLHIDILDFKLSPCSIYNMFSFGYFRGVLVLIADVYFIYIYIYISY